MTQQGLGPVIIRSIPFARSGRYAFLASRETNSQSICNVVLVYGHHSTLERWLPLARELTRFGCVWIPDLPGFGGMDEEPDSCNLDMYADHLAEFVSAVVGGGPLLLCGGSFGFVVIKEAVGRHRNLAMSSLGVVSVGGFVAGSSLKLKTWQKICIKVFARATRHRFVALSARALLLTYPAARLVDLTFGLTRKRAGADRKRSAALCAADLALWRANSIATHWATLESMLGLRRARTLDLPCVHIQNPADPYISYSANVLALGRVFADLYVSAPEWVGHMPALDAPQEAYAAVFDEECIEAIQSHMDASPCLGAFGKLRLA